MIAYRGLWNECKKLWNNKKIYSYFAAIDTVRIKQVENDPCKHHTCQLFFLICLYLALFNI